MGTPANDTTGGGGDGARSLPDQARHTRPRHGPLRATGIARDHRLQRVGGPGGQRIRAGGQVPVELPQRTTPGSGLGDQETGISPVQAGDRAGDGGGNPVQDRCQRPAGAGTAVMTHRAGAPRCGGPSARAAPPCRLGDLDVDALTDYPEGARSGWPDPAGGPGHPFQAWHELVIASGITGHG